MKFIAFLFVFIGFVAHAETLPVFGDVVKITPKSKKFCSAPYLNQPDLCIMTNADAHRYCQSIGQHLPSAREYARYAASKGASFSDKADGPHVFNFDGNRESFVSSGKGYNDPEFSSGRLWFMTSSGRETLTYHPYDPFKYIVFWPVSGNLEYLDPVYYGIRAAVRCAMEATIPVAPNDEKFDGLFKIKKQICTEQGVSTQCEAATSNQILISWFKNSNSIRVASRPFSSTAFEHHLYNYSLVNDQYSEKSTLNIREDGLGFSYTYARITKIDEVKELHSTYVFEVLSKNQFRYLVNESSKYPDKSSTTEFLLERLKLK